MFRDCSGIRPLVYFNDAYQIYIASESCAIPEQFQTNIKNLQPGQAVWIKEDLEMVNIRKIPLLNNNPTPCLFEFIYLAHDDSIIDGIHVKTAREHMGKILVPKINVHVDLIVPIPHTPILAGKVIGKPGSSLFFEAFRPNFC